MKKIIGIVLVLLGGVLISCQNEKTEDVNDDEVLSEKAAQITMDEVMVEGVLSETEYEIDFYANAEGRIFQMQRMGQLWKWTNKLRYRIQQCPELEIVAEDGDYPKTITLDYGEATELQNGKILSGVIIIEISAPRNSIEYQRNVTYDNFGIDSLVINGTSVISVDKEDESFRTFASDIVLTFADGTSAGRTSERVWQWIEGMDTELDQTDDVIQITGYANVETSEGDTYKKEIVEPLIRIRDCRFIVEGVVEITLNGELISTLNYGDGNCDAVATITKDGESFDVDLAGHKIDGKRYDHRKGNGGNGNQNQNGNGGGNG